MPDRSSRSTRTRWPLPGSDRPDTSILTNLSAGCEPQDESAEPRALSRTTLRRIVPSFTVEVRRRPRLAAASRPTVQSLETKPPPAAFDRESHPAEAAAIGAKKAAQSPVDASAPKGRILPSLVADEPLSRLLPDASLSATESAPTSRAPKRSSVRPVKGRTHTFKPRRSSEPLPAESTSMAEQLSAASRQPNSARSDEGIGVLPTDPTTALSQVIASSGGPALRAKAKHQEKIPISRDGRATPLLNSQRSTTGTNSPATPPSSVDEHSPQSRKRTIMGRYVFDDELKPGARWKQRLLGMR